MAIELRERIVVFVDDHRVRLTWISPRSIGLNNGSIRAKFFEVALLLGAELNCPKGVGQLVADYFTDNGLVPFWNRIRVCEVPHGDMVVINVVETKPQIVPYKTDSTFCDAREWWVAVMIS